MRNEYGKKLRECYKNMKHIGQKNIINVNEINNNNNIIIIIQSRNIDYYGRQDIKEGNIKQAIAKKNKNLKKDKNKNLSLQD